MNRNKILFLDVDGVLNCSSTEDRAPCGALGVDSEKVKHLEKIARETDCSIVISSTWRLFPDSMEYLYEKMGLELRERCVGCTPNNEKHTKNSLYPGKTFYMAATRGSEIKSYLDGLIGFRKFVILDDNDDMDGLASHLIQTSFKDGLTDEIARKAIERLNEF